MSKEIELTISQKHLNQELASLPELASPMAEFLYETYKPEGIFGYADLKWQEQYSGERLKQTISELKEINAARSSLEAASKNQNLTDLKELRRTGTRRVDCWKLTSADHYCPIQFERVVSSIGDFKDAVWFLGKENRDADKLISRIDALSSNPEPAFVPAGFESFMGMYNKYLTDIRNILDLETPSLLEHHTLRRRVRTLRHYFALVYSATKNETAKELAAYLEPISVEMGKAQDQIFVMESTGSIDVNVDVTKIHPRHREIIEAFLSLNK